jgi:hypothetical protein
MGAQLPPFVLLAVIPERMNAVVFARNYIGLTELAIERLAPPEPIRVRLCLRGRGFSAHI